MPKTDEGADGDYSPTESEHEERKVKSSSAEYVPLAFSGKSFSFDKSEPKIVKTLRTWIESSFQEHAMLPAKWTTALKDIPVATFNAESGKLYDFDILAKVTLMMRIDEYTSELRLLDGSGDVWFCQANTSRLRHVWEGAYVRIRAASIEKF